MGDVQVFFEHLDQHGHELLPGKVSGTIRFDLTHGDQIDYWMVAVKKGNVFVSQENQEADAVLSTDLNLFEQIVSGQTDLVAGILRNQISVEGNLSLLLAFRRALPDVPGAHDPRVAATVGTAQPALISGEAPVPAPAREARA